MTRVETQHDGYKMRFILRNGQSATHSKGFTFKGKDYYFLGGVYYDLQDDLINHIFGEQPCH